MIQWNFFVNDTSSTKRLFFLLVYAFAEQVCSSPKLRLSMCVNESIDNLNARETLTNTHISRIHAYEKRALCWKKCQIK